MNEFEKWWSNNITEINKRYEDGTLQEFIYLAGTAAMREKCAEVVDGWAVNNGNAVVRNASTDIAAAIRKIEVE